MGIEHIIIITAWAALCWSARYLGPIVVHVSRFGFLNRVVQFVNADSSFNLDGGGIAWFWPFVIGHPDSIAHETYHFKQQCELLVLPFFVLYAVFGLWLWRKHGRGRMAYWLNPFERAARARDERLFGWVHHMGKLK